MNSTLSTLPVEKTRQSLAQVVLVFVAYYGLWILSRFFQPVVYAVYALGVAFPLLSAFITKDWSASGFTTHNWRSALLWGTTIGLGLCLGLGLLPLALVSQPAPTLSPRQLRGGILLAFLVISPFQEFLFRGWMQPRLARALGRAQGLIACSLLFAVWDTLPQLQGVSLWASVRASLQLVPVSFGFALLVGYIFQRTGNILAPWLAHSLAVAGLVITGRIVLIR
jgi:membrane protease YdiL (CAAX protease family)